MEINISRHTKNNLSALTINQLALVYKEVFAGPPWDEAWKCNLCNTTQGLSFAPGNNCPSCKDGSLVEAYSTSEVEDQIVGNFDKPNSVLYAVHSNHDVCGFAWGYVTTMDKILGHIEQLSRPLVLMAIGQLGISRPSVFTAAEIGILSSIRGHGVGKELVRNLVGHSSAVQEPISVWTRHDTVATPISLKLGFSQVYGPQVILKDGKITVTPKIISDIHPTVPERVLFIRANN